jgi:Metallopeptidase toxin 3
MRISTEFEKKFPKCARHITDYLSSPSLLVHSEGGSVWAAFMRACVLDMSDAQAQLVRNTWARQALTLAQGPWVMIFSKEKFLGAEKRKVCGHFHPGLSTPGLPYPLQDQIWITDEALDAYEHGPGWKVLEGTLLHECVHWVRFKIFGDEPTKKYEVSPQANAEVGDIFEFEAYGFSICQRSPTTKKLLEIGPPGTEPTMLMKRQRSGLIPAAPTPRPKH